MLASMRLVGGMREKRAWPRRTTPRAVAIATALACFGPLAPADESRAPVVFAAASTAIPLGALAQSFERGNGAHVKLSLAASSTLARQVIEGASASMFLSANTLWMDQLEKAGLLVEESRRALLYNRLAVLRHKNNQAPVRLDQPATLLAALEDFPLVMADPAHVPAGMYAQEALEKLRLWDRLQGRLAFVPNARAVTVWIARGEAPLGLTYLSELEGMSDLQVAATIPPETHSPIRYELALIAPQGNSVAQAFYDFLLTDEALAVFEAQGFTPGNEGVPPSSKARAPLPATSRAGRPRSQEEEMTPISREKR